MRKYEFSAMTNKKTFEIIAKLLIIPVVITETLATIFRVLYKFFDTITDEIVNFVVNKREKLK
jgi:hypothetical protein